MQPAAKRPRTADGGDAGGVATPLERQWTAQFKQLPPKQQVEVISRRREFGHSGLLLDANTPPKKAVEWFAAQLNAWCPDATSVSVARCGSGGLALGLADTFDIVHAFEADAERSNYLKHNVELTEKDWVLVHGPATDEEGDYLFALEEIESDVVLVNLLCAENSAQPADGGHESGSEFCEAVEMLIQAIFGKVKMVVALLPGDFDVAKLQKAVSDIPRATKSTAMKPSSHGNLLLQPIKLGAWGAHLESHQLLQSPVHTAPTQAQKKQQKKHKNSAASAGACPRPLARFRAFESWVKRCFVSHAAAGARKPGSSPPDLVWLDMACGRGADIDSIVESGASHLVLADADEEMLTRAINRFNKKKCYRTTMLDAALGDLGADLRLRKRVKRTYDVVTCFRGLQYGFSDERAAQNWLKNASSSLRKGGVFVGIIPDANVIVKRLQATVATSKPGSVTDPLTIENQSYSIDLSATAAESDSSSSFGHRYRFWLGGAAAKAAGDPGDDEYLVHLPTLLSMAKEQGLELISFTGLHSFYSDCINGKALSDLSGMPVAGAAQLANQRMKQWLCGSIERLYK